MGRWARCLARPRCVWCGLCVRACVCVCVGGEGVEDGKRGGWRGFAMQCDRIGID
jgi:formate hydrogenlyase subunit 6/NADH:ubiquinone oxidoreductase subunit I